MQRATGDPNLTAVRSPVNTHGTHPRPDGISTRRLSTAIDALRREGETLLWELNSLMTQNSSLEQRLLLQAEELDMLARGLVNLRDQHTTMEQQYKEKLRALQAELAGIQEEQRTATPRATNPGLSGRDRRSPAYASSPGHLGGERGGLDSRPQSPLPSRTRVPARPYTPLSNSSASPLHYREERRNSYRGPDSMTSNIRQETTRGSSRSPPGSKTTSSHSTTTVRSPRLSHASWGSPRHISAEDAPTPTGSQHEPSLSPTATLIDPPSRPKSRKTRM
ncbi:hypothetical protein M422DRAFT_71179 [Sphaerobolus stellatus SS14]|uniref:Transcriptional repressor Tup1 N-terminal domain-containing protein n=1 Tax=Sphaerobolus stellatus (strain SS14) TaxID=990650 RepID=A0A0C9ULG2_SPHS4|nr:hypothetical protein M422DRAFT_71179 [Sphaerobolus stellatus SS14]